MRTLKTISTLSIFTLFSVESALAQPASTDQASTNVAPSDPEQTSAPPPNPVVASNAEQTSVPPQPAEACADGLQF